MALSGEKVFLVMQSMGHATIILAVCDARDVGELHAQNIREQRGPAGQNIWVDKFEIMGREDVKRGHS